MNRAIVTGAGIGGIAAAIRLAARGYAVDVFEASDQPGGKLTEINKNGYRFDAGPSLFTLPELVTELFELCGEKPENSFRFQSLEVICKYYYPDGTILKAYQQPDRFAAEIQDVLGEEKENVLKFLDRSREIYELTAPVFIFRSFHKLSTFLSRPFLKALLRWHRLDPLRTMHQANQAWFKDPRLVQLFDRYATYNGSDPYKAPATLNVIPHLEHNKGAFFPEKGMYDIVKTLVALSERHGVRYHYSEPVESIVSEGNTVTGVRTPSGIYKASLVVSDIDIVHTYRLLNRKLPDKFLKQERSSSALIFYWGITREFPELELHNILFAKHYEEEFQHLFHSKTIYHDPTIYLFISSKIVAGDAPAGCENWFTMINVPENDGQDWSTFVKQARKHIISKISAVLGTAIEPLIAFEEILDPVKIEQYTSSFHGSLYGNSSNNRFAAFRRHPNFLRSVKGFFFTGGSVHPGGGIPLCLASAKIVDGMVGDKS
ncbi:MAG: phytoene desaturase [Bacteroidales bacterium]|nr:phytoene desaturase [Bacteroidales bacterium]